MFRLACAAMILIGAASAAQAATTITFNGLKKANPLVCPSLSNGFDPHCIFGELQTSAVAVQSSGFQNLQGVTPGIGLWQVTAQLFNESGKEVVYVFVMNLKKKNFVYYTEASKPQQGFTYGGSGTLKIKQQ